MGGSFPNPAPFMYQANGTNIEQTDDNYLKLIEELKHLIPVECKDKIKSLEEVISYVSAILYGDDLHKFAAYNYYKKYVTQALDELVIFAQEHSLDDFSKRIALLKDEINYLLIERKTYSKDVSMLLSEKEKLVVDVQSLKDENAALRLENDKIKESLKEYQTIMQKLGESDQVVWEKISDEDPLYAITPSKITDYIYELKQAYMKKLGISEKECDSDFMLNSSGLFELKTLLLSFDKSDYHYPVRSLMVMDLGPYSNCKRSSLAALMRNIKLPRVIKNTKSLTSNDLFNNCDNVNGVLRELYLQRMALNALSKQKIAESQVYTLIQMLKKLAPSDYDFSQIMELDGGYDPSMLKLLTDSETEHRNR